MLLCTSRAARSDMRGWVVTDEGHRWTVKMDVRDLGRHLDTTVKGCSATLATRVRDGIEASFLADTSFRKLRTAIFRAVWSCLQPLANTGAVLGLLDAPAGCDPVFCFVWYRFRMFRRYLAYRPGEVHRVYWLISGAAEGSLAMALRICLLKVLLRLGFSGILACLGGSGLDYPVHSNLAAPC